MKKEATPAQQAKKPAAKTEELKTEPPISEKDEVKQAEDKTNKAAAKRT